MSFQPFDNLFGPIKPFSNAHQDPWFDLDVECLSIGPEKQLGSSISRSHVPAVERMSFWLATRWESAFFTLIFFKTSLLISTTSSAVRYRIWDKYALAFRN